MPESVGIFHFGIAWDVTLFRKDSSHGFDREASKQRDIRPLACRKASIQDQDWLDSRRNSLPEKCLFEQDELKRALSRNF